MPDSKVRSKVAAVLTTGLMSVFPAVALAASAGAIEPAQRWPLASLGLGFALLGLWVAKILTSKWELNTLGKVRRWVGVFLAASGLFLVLFATVEAPPSPGELPWVHSYDKATEASKSSNRPMMIDFTADWCVACQEMEAEVFHHEDVRDRLSQEVVLLKVDFDEETKINEELRNRFRISGLPAIAFVTPTGEHIEAVSFEGKLSVEEFSAKLDALQSGEYGDGAEGEFARTMREKGLLAALLLVFLAGLMSSLTPCVYPLIPITISIFGAKEATSRLQGFSLSLVYVLGIVITYTILGVAAASFGTVFGGAMQNPWILISISLLFLVLGASSAGAFDFRLPGNLQTTLSQKGGAGYAGAFVMGLVAGVIAAPCVGPIVAGILLYVAQQQDVVLGGLLLMTFAFGMGMLFLVLGTFSSLLTKIPKSGGWMESVKVVFGAVFIAMALYYLQFVATPIGDAVNALWLLVG